MSAVPFKFFFLSSIARSVGLLPVQLCLGENAADPLKSGWIFLLHNKTLKCREMTRRKEHTKLLKIISIGRCRICLIRKVNDWAQAEPELECEHFFSFAHCHSVFKEGSVREELAVVTVMSESKAKRALSQKLNPDPHPSFALPSDTNHWLQLSRLKRENAELLLLDNSSSSRTFIKPTPLLFKIFEQVVAWLPPSFRGLLTPALTQQNKAETFALHTIPPLPCSPCTKWPPMKGRQSPEL